MIENNFDNVSNNVYRQVIAVGNILESTWETHINESGKSEYESLKEVIKLLENELSFSLNSTISINIK